MTFSHGAKKLYGSKCLIAYKRQRLELISLKIKLREREQELEREREGASLFCVWIGYGITTSHELLDMRTNLPESERLCVGSYEWGGLWNDERTLPKHQYGRVAYT